MNVLINDFPQEDLRKRSQAYQTKQRRGLTPGDYAQQIIKAHLDAFENRAASITDDFERCAKIVQSEQAEKLIDQELITKHDTGLKHVPTNRQWLKEFTPYEMIY